MTVAVACTASACGCACWLIPFWRCLTEATALCEGSMPALSAPCCGTHARWSADGLVCGAGAACNISLSRWQKPCVAQHRDACSNMELLSRDAAGPRTAEMAGCRDAARDHSGLSHSTMEGTRAAWPPRPRGTPVLAARHTSHTLLVYIPSARTWTNTGGRTLALRPSARALPARRLRPPARRQTALRRARPAPARPRPPRRRRRRRPRRPPPPRRPAAPQKRRPQRAAGHAAA